MKLTLLTASFMMLFSFARSQNNSLLFDGLNDKVSVASDPVFNLTNGFTLEAWIYADVWKPNVWQGTIIAKDLDPQTGFVLRTGANGTLSFTVGTGSTWNEVTSGPVMSSDTWYHVAAVLDGGQSKIYINGSLVGSSSCPAAASSNTNILIGESSGFAGRVFEGRIDEVRIWNIARTMEQISADLAVDLATDTPGLIAYFKLDETSGTTAENFIDPGVTDGTLINFGASPWQSGYTIPGLDLKIEAILSPDPLTLSQGVGQVKARFLNNGLDPISSFQVAYSFNGGPDVVEQVTMDLAPGASYVHTFNDLVVSNGDQDALVVSAMLTDDSNILNDALEMSYLALEQAYTIEIFQSEQHNFAAAGQSHLSQISLPENNSEYGQLLMIISVDCPGTGCDPWDQPAKISLVKDGVTYELARFITPYGKACGPWTIDVTSFKSILQGDCEFLSYIQVWGASGWLLNVDLVFVPEEVDFPFQKVTPVYDTDNWVYGDPGIEDDLPTISLPVDQSTAEAEYRMTITGHGQANTNNAAEFSPKTHTVMANGSAVQSHFLWKNDCEFNDCANQFGTWTFDRAGWCPGQGVDPLLIDISDIITAGSMVDLDYELEAYTNFLNTGYNGGSHTEPHYKIHAYLVEKGAQHFSSTGWNNSTAVQISNPVIIGDLSVSTPVTVEFKNTGTEDITQVTLKAYLNGLLEVEDELVLTSPLLSGESMSHTFSAPLDMSATDMDIDLSVLVYSADDEAANDNVLNTHFDLVTGIETAQALLDVQVYPNPTTGEIILFAPGIKGVSICSIFDFQGRQLYRHSLPTGVLTTGHRLELELAIGTYLMEIQSDGNSAFKTIIME
ncbi:MAG: peptide-N-glycosidase F-related protein [Bacteroidetes bacterium]|nr:peptide-N-glycosidase F-related protein [Bacteroidota bacterium]